MIVPPKTTKRIIRTDAGFGTTSIALLITIVAGTALFASVAQSWYGASSAAKQELANGAREAGEAGISAIIAEMNERYPYLLVIDEEDWENPTLNSSTCSNNQTTGTPSKNGSVGSSGSYELVNYDFEGNQIFGGTAVIQVRGNVSNTSVSATALIEKTIKIIPKSCNTSFEAPPSPGLLAENIDMGNNDIFGSGGNVICTQCTNNIPSNCNVDSDTPLIEYTEADKRCVIGGQNNMVVGGEIYLGPVDFPPVPRLPSSLYEVTAASISSNSTIIAGSTKSSELLNGSCIVNSDGITQCKVDEINLTGNRKLIINTSNGGAVQIYVVGNKISLKGRSKIEHQPLTESAAKVALFGNPIDANDNNDQLVELKGKTKINNIITFFPDGNVGISGGGNVSYSCSGGGDEVDCSGGNFHGAVWAKEWGMSNSNVARITIPLNMGEDIEEYYPDFRLGSKSYVAAGTSGYRVLNIAQE